MRVYLSFHKEEMREIDFYQKPTYIKQFSKKLRKEQTEAEKLLREKLRGKKCDGLRFHRQKALFVYREEIGGDKFLIADFYHHPKRLVIEIDGEIHIKKEVRKNDKLREELLEKKGYIIIRFKNEEVFSDIELVKRKNKKTKKPLYFRGIGGVRKLKKIKERENAFTPSSRDISKQGDGQLFSHGPSAESRDPYFPQGVTPYQ